MTEIPKSCTTCQHREGRGKFSKCTATGYYAQVSRAHPVFGCDKNFSMWENVLD